MKASVRVGEKGSMLPLMAGLVTLCLTLILGISSVTSLALERQRLHALAEGAALYAAESFDPATLRMGSGELVVPLTSSTVRASAIHYLENAGVSHHESLRLVAADTPDSRRARVVVSATWRPPVVSAYVPLQVRVTARAHSRVLIR